MFDQQGIQRTQTAELGKIVEAEEQFLDVIHQQISLPEFQIDHVTLLRVRKEDVEELLPLLTQVELVLEFLDGRNEHVLEWCVVFDLLQEKVLHVSVVLSITSLGVNDDHVVDGLDLPQQPLEGGEAMDVFRLPRIDLHVALALVVEEGGQSFHDVPVEVVVARVDQDHIHWIQNSCDIKRVR